MAHAALARRHQLWLVLVMISIFVGWAATVHAVTPYFVSLTGSDANDCLSLTTACQHITAALGKASAGDIVIVANGTYTENLTIDKDITLIGFGQDVTAISGGGVGRVVTVTDGVSADISNVTLQNGSGGVAGGLYISGTARLSRVTLAAHFQNAIYNAGILTATALTIDRSYYLGLINLGTATLSDSVISNNGTGIVNYGTFQLASSGVTSNTDVALSAGIANYGVMAIDQAVIRANFAYNTFGAGVYNSGRMSISNSLIMSNTGYSPPPPAYGPTWVHSGGGGIYNDWRATALTVTNSAIFGNSATDGGDQVYNDGTATLVNVTLSGATGYGGLVTNGIITLTNVTMSQMPSGVYVNGNTYIRNSVMDVGCFHPATSLGHNIDSGNTCGFTATGDLTNTNPLLGPLQDNGGPTPTYAIPANSPAVNTGDNTGCPPTDQRGIARPQAGRCDIGAYEYVFPIKLFLPVIKR